MTKKYKIIICVFCLIIAVNLIVKYSVIQDQAHEISILEKGVVKARKGSQNKSGAGIIKEEEEIKFFFNALPEFVSFTEYAVTIRELIDTNQLIIEDSLIFVPEKTERTDLLQFHSNIRVVGDYGKIKQFIADIQNLPGLNYMNAVNITREKEAPDRIKLSLELAVFFKRGPV